MKNYFNGSSRFFGLGLFTLITAGAVFSFVFAAPLGAPLSPNSTLDPVATHNCGPLDTNCFIDSSVVTGTTTINILNATTTNTQNLFSSTTYASTSNVTNLSVTNSTTSNSTSTTLFSNILTALSAIFGNITATGTLSVSGLSSLFGGLTTSNIVATGTAQMANISASTTNASTTNTDILVANNGTITSATITNLYAPNFQISTLDVVNGTVTNSTSTNSFIASLVSSIVNAVSAIFTNATITNATIINGTSTNFAIVNGLKISSGGTGTTTLPTLGQILVGNSFGGYDYISTSSLVVATSSFASSTTIGATVQNATATGIFYLDANGKLAQDTQFFNYDAASKKLTVAGGVDPLFLQLKDVTTASGSGAYLEFYAGNNAQVASPTTGRIIYNATTSKFMASVNGGPYQEFAVSGGDIYWNNATGVNATITNATTTNLFASIFNAVSGFISTLTASLINVGTINATSSINALVINASTTNASTTNTNDLIAINSTITNATVTGILTSYNVRDSYGATGTAGQFLMNTGTSTRWQSFSSGALASGTATSSTLRWDGSNWVENTAFLVDASGNSTSSNATNTGNLSVISNITSGTLNSGTTTLGTTTVSTSSITWLNVLNTLWANMLSVLNLNATNATITNATSSNFATGNLTATGTTVLATTTIATAAIGNASIVSGTANLTDATITNATTTNLVSANTNAGTLAAGTTTLGTTTISTSSITSLNVLATLWANMLSVLGLTATDATITNATTSNFATGNLTATGTTVLATTTIATATISAGSAILSNATITNSTSTNLATLNASATTITSLGTSTFATTTVSSSSVSWLNVLTNLFTQLLNVAGTSTLATTTITAATANQLTLASGTNSTTTNTLYNTAGNLYWNGTQVATGSTSPFTYYGATTTLTTAASTSNISLQKYMEFGGYSFNAGNVAVSRSWGGIGYGNGTFVIVSNGGAATSQIQYSTDTGATWTAVDSPVGPSSFNSVAYGGGQFVLVTNTSTTTVLTSPDAVTWTPRTMSSTATAKGVAYGGGKYVVVGTTGAQNDRIQTSSDGITWATTTVPVLASWQAVTYGGGQFVATGALGEIITSPDAITWTQRTSPAANSFDSITYGGGKFVAVSTNGTIANQVMYSTDGITWTSASSTNIRTWTGVSYGNGTFVSVASDGTSANQVMYSTDGITWTTGTAALTQNWIGIAYGNGKFISVNTAGITNAIMISSGGETGQNIFSVGTAIRQNILSITDQGLTALSNALSLASVGTTPSNLNITTTSNALYNVGGTLYWNGNAVGDGSLSVIYGESIAAGDLIQLSASTTAPGNLVATKLVSNTTADTAIATSTVLNSSANANASNSAYPGVALVSASSHTFIHVYSTSTTDLTATLATVDPTTLAISSTTPVSAPSVTNAGQATWVCVNSAGTKGIVGYTNNSGNFARGFTISGSTITWGTSSSAQIGTSVKGSCLGTDNGNKFLFSDPAGGQIYAVDATNINSLAISSPYAITTPSSSQRQGFIRLNDTNMYGVVSANSTSNAMFRAFEYNSVSDTFTTRGSDLQVGAAGALAETFDSNSVVATRVKVDSSTSTIVIAAQASATSTMALIAPCEFNLSTYTKSCGSKIVVNTGMSNGVLNSELTGNESVSGGFIFTTVQHGSFGAGNNRAFSGKVSVGNIISTTTSVITPFPSLLTNIQHDGGHGTASNGTGVVLRAYNGSAGSNSVPKIAALRFQASSITVANGSFAGVANVSGSISQSGLISLIGGVARNVYSGLVAGTAYYIDQNTGSLTTANTGWFAGRAVSSTSLLIDNDKISSTTVSIPTASGVSGQLQFNSGGFLGTSAQLIWDNVLNRLGVGVSTVVNTLTVGGDGSFSGPLLVGTTSNVFTNFTSASTSTGATVNVAFGVASTTAASYFGNALILASNTAATTTNALYNIAGILYWNGQAVGSGGGGVSSVTLSNFTASTTVGTAAATVDIYTNLNISQASSSVVLSLPNPTVTTAGKTITVNNTGSAMFTMYDTEITTSESGIFIWNGSAWKSITGKGNVGAEYGQVSITDGVFVSANSFGDFSVNQTFTVPTAGVWEIGYVVNAQSSNQDVAGSMQLVNVTNGNAVVTNSQSRNARGSASGTGDNYIATAQVTTTGPTTYKLQGAIASGNLTVSNDSTVGATGGGAYFTYRKISGNAAVIGQSVDYINVGSLSSNVSAVSANTAVIFPTVLSGNIPYNTSNGQFTLTAGKTYKLYGNLVSGTAATTQHFYWYNVTAGANIPNGGGTTMANDNAASIANSPAVVDFTPTVNTIVELRSVGTGSYTAGNVNQAGSTVSITQLGTTATTEYSNNILGNFTASSTIMSGTLSEYINHIQISQASTSLTLSIPTPTNTSLSRIVYIDNTGTANFTMHGVTVGAGESAAFKWNGTTWKSFGNQAANVAAEYGENNVITDSQVITSANTDVGGSTFTIPTAGVWEVDYNIFLSQSGAGTASSFYLTDSSDVEVADSRGYANAMTVNNVQSISQTVRITTTGSKNYKLKVGIAGTQTTIYNNASTRSKITWKKISGYIPVSGQTVDYVYAQPAASTNVAPNTAIPFTSVVSGNIPHVGNGRYRLEAGKTYRLEAAASSNNTANDTGYKYQWVDVTASTTIGNANSGSDVAAIDHWGGTAVAIITPTVTTDVEVRIIVDNATTLATDLSYLSIQQLGSSVMTSESILANGGQSGFNATFGTLTNNFARIIASSTEYMRVLATGQGLIGTTTVNQTVGTSTLAIVGTTTNGSANILSLFSPTGSTSLVLTNSGSLMLGTSTAPTNSGALGLLVNTDFNGAGNLIVRNSSTGTSAYTGLELRNGALDTDSFTTAVAGENYTPFGLYLPDAAVFSARLGLSNGLTFVSETATGSMRFATGGVGANNLRMSITGTGQILVGTTTINTSVGTSSLAIVSTTTNGSVNALAIFTPAGSSSMVFTNAGRLGIGTTSPQSMLHLYSATSTDNILYVEAQGNNYAYTTYRSGNTTNGINRMDIGTGPSTDDRYFVWTYGTRNLDFGTNNTQRMRIGNDGSFYVGTTTALSAINFQAISTSTNILSVASSTGANVLTIAANGGMGIGTTTNRYGGMLTTGLTLNNALVLASSTALSTTSMALYNNNGTLYWNGGALGGSASTTAVLGSAINLSQSFGSMITAFVGSSTGFTNFSGGIGTGGADSQGFAQRITNAGNLTNIGSIQNGGILSTAGGTYSAGTSYGTGASIRSISLGDLNGDGNKDIVTSNSASNTMTIYWGNGTGSFTASSTLTTQANPQQNNIADLNGDGKMDIVVNHSGIASVSVFLNSNGTFPTRADYTVFSSAYSSGGTGHIGVGDVNGDGKPDLVVPSAGVSFSVLMNNGNGTFASKVDYSIGAATVDIALADLNGDGKADIITGGGSSPNIYVRMNNGDGTFGATTSYVSGVSTLASALAAADLNNDGAVDIAVQNTNGTSISVFMNTGNGTLAAKVEYTSSDGYGLAVADVNGDGYVDLVPGIYSTPSPGFAILYNNGNGTFTPRVIMPTGVSGYTIAVGDLNNDGKPDVVTGPLTNGAINVMLSNPRTMIHANAFTGLVSIGTSTATSSNNAILYIANSSSTSLTDLFKVSSSTGLIAFNIASNGSIQMGTSTKYGTFNLQAISTSSPIFSLASSTGANVLTLTASGNLGIGTTTPIAKLSLAGTNGATYMDISDTHASGNGVLRLVTSGGVNYIQSATTTSGGSVAPLRFTNMFGGNPWMVLNADQSMSFGTTTIAGGFNFQSIATSSNMFSVASSSGTNVLTINASGNVGIGTTTPNANLFVYGTTGQNLFQIGTSTNKDILVVDQNGRVKLGGGSNASGALQISNDLTTNGDVVSISATQVNTGNILALSGGNITSGNSLSISGEHRNLTTGSLLKIRNDFANDFTTTWTGAMALMEANLDSTTNANGSLLKVGFVGSGDTSSGTALNITSSQTGANALVLRVNDDGTYTDSSPFVIDHDGKVGIGSVTPDAKLLVQSQSGDSLTSNLLKLATSTGAQFMSVLGNGLVTLGVQATTSNQNLLMITPSTGSGLGIGWNHTGGGGETDFFNYSGLGQGGYNFYNHVSSGTVIPSNSAASLLMTISGNGKVGIGTSTPTNLFDIYSSTTAAISTLRTSADSYVYTSYISSSTSQHLDVGVGNSGDNKYFVWGYGAEKGLSLGTNGADRLYISPTGNVGIGTTTPDQLLSLSGNNAAINIRNSSNGSVGWISKFTDRFALASANDVILYASSTNGTDGTALRLTQSGTLSLIGSLSTLGFSTGVDGVERNSINYSNASARAIEFDGNGSTNVLRFYTGNDGSVGERANIDISGNLQIGIGGNDGCLRDGDGTTLAGTCASDENLKTNILTLDTADMLTKIAGMNPVTYNWKDNATGTAQYGIIAQQIESVAPEFVVTDENGGKKVHFDMFNTYFIGAIKELNNKVFGTKNVQAVSIEEITASSTISVDDKLKALGVNAKQVNDMLAQLASTTSATSSVTTTETVNTSTQTLSCPADTTIGTSMNGGYVTSVTSTTSSIVVQGQIPQNITTCVVTTYSTTTNTVEDLTFVGKLIARMIEEIKGYLATASSVFIGKVETNEICVKKADGTPVCLNAEQLEGIKNSLNAPAVLTPPSSEPLVFDPGTCVAPQVANAENNACVNPTPVTPELPPTDPENPDTPATPAE